MAVPSSPGIASSGASKPMRAGLCEGQVLHGSEEAAMEVLQIFLARGGNVQELATLCRREPSAVEAIVDRARQQRGAGARRE
ncbi:hypothetical protein N9L68_07875 [bacterium]|nr:hypothetical protein [bacterium]